ncbi:hypothetical protein Tcan_06364 [Toxocara canis]|uniref:Uncharacterized protein n=1 Tax=Toxocara canis TaxID=6265 RepID=A0A0B2W0Y2_TOXCA|nr:hypothetical protein Tcan_06364 [Toxocara canis]
MAPTMTESRSRSSFRQEIEETTLEKTRREIRTYTDRPLEIKVVDGKSSFSQDTKQDFFDVTSLQELYSRRDQNTGENVQKREGEKGQNSANEKSSSNQSAFTDIALTRTSFTKDVMKTEILSKQCQNIVNREIGMWIERNMFEMQQINELRKDLLSRSSQVMSLNRELRHILDSLQQNWCGST